jgi:hypothetical protein
MAGQIKAAGFWLPGKEVTTAERGCATQVWAGMVELSPLDLGMRAEGIPIW